jgi:hypothetical protein
MFILLSFFSDTTEVLELFLVLERKRNDNSIGKKPKPPSGFRGLGF